jgi:hypothetical protein
MIVLSTIEAKYMASVQAIKEGIWMTKFMKELGYVKKRKVMVIQCDDQGVGIIDEEPHPT